MGHSLVRAVWAGHRTVLADRNLAVRVVDLLEGHNSAVLGVDLREEPIAVVAVLAEESLDGLAEVLEAVDDLEAVLEAVPSFVVPDLAGIAAGEDILEEDGRTLAAGEGPEGHRMEAVRRKTWVITS